MDGKTFPTLYKRDSRGKIMEWKIGVIPDPDSGHAYQIYTDHGQREGKKQTTVDTITKGKNIGKANETTARQQAIAEAESKWNKQKDRKGYVEDLGKIDVDARPGAEPMLAHRYDKYAHKIEFPAMIQPKLDGHRCIAEIWDSDTVNLYSRQRAKITGLPHIEKALGEYYDPSLLTAPIYIDGELYNHDYKDNFEELTGFIRSETPKEGHEVVQFYVYDIVLPDKDFIERYNRLVDLFGKDYGDFIVFTPTIDVESSEEVKYWFKRHLEEGYEGSIIRNLNGGYEGKRSYNLQKIKELNDEEFEITNIKEGRGKMKGHAIFECVTSDGQTFEAKMKGPMEKLREYFSNPEPYIGKYVTVQHQGYTNSGKPRFPVALRFREDI